MYITSIKTLLVEATKATFNGDYPETDFRDIWVSMEYPSAEANYPGIWVDFAPTTDLQVAGIDHYEWSDPDQQGNRRRMQRWRYAGNLQFTVVALTSLERDRLVDELVKVLAFGLENPQTATFRKILTTNDLIAVDAQWDKFNLNGKGETPGTPWGTNDVIYEMTIAMDCQGSFCIDPADVTFVPLSKIVVFDWIEGQTPPPIPAPGPGGWQ